MTRRAFSGAIPGAAALALGGRDEAAGQTACEPSAPISPDEARFEAIAEAEWNWRRAQFADYNENEPIPPYLPDVSAEAQEARLQKWRGIETELASFNPASFSIIEKDNFVVYKGQIDARLASWSFKDWQAPFNSDTSFWAEMLGVTHRTFHGQEDYSAYIAQIRQTPRFFAQQIAAMRLGMARGFTPPKVMLHGRDESVATVAEAASPEATEFFKPFTAMPDTMEPALKAELVAEGRAVIASEVIPAHRQLLAFLRSEYLPRCRETIAAEALPDGKAYYLSKIREFTTLDLPPEEIHATGLSELAKIRAEMAQTMKEAEFTGDFPGFVALLRSDPRFYVKTPQDLLDAAAWICKEVDGKAKDWFGRLPRARFGIRPVPASIAPFYTAGRGGLGVYLLNTYDLPARPLYALTALTLHESAPGHAFQIPLALEIPDLPDYRRKSYISAYGEGWALYCERLGMEMDMYKTAYDRFGMLSYQAWRACRLVVDTGIHAMGWSRERAIDYLAANTALSSQEIGTEVDRYISWPGQALSYYLGEMAIWTSRRKAETALGPKFEIRHFHDAVLKLGCVPLSVIGDRIDRFITEGGRSPWPPSGAT
ncbi:MAG: DUF885 domain-containing protein [Caulobacteraceae bacterium]